MAPTKRQSKNKLGLRLREVRDKRGWSLRDVAARARINHGYLSQLERAEIAEPGPSMLHRIAEGYDVRFQVVMEWAGYIQPEGKEVSPNHALALSYIGDNPTAEELEAVRAVLDAIRSRGATFTSTLATLDAPLAPEEREVIRGYVQALLRRSDALGSIPTPLDQLMEVAGLVRAGEISLTDAEKRELRKRFGSLVDRVLGRVLGAIHMRAREVWVQPDLHQMKRRFVTAHEIGHDILPSAHQLANLDNEVNLRPDVRIRAEREANHAAIEILAQGDALRKEADDSVLSITLLSQMGARYEISFQATARYIVEETRREAAATIRFRNAETGNVGPAHVYCSERFESRFGWQARGVLPSEARAAATSALQAEGAQLFQTVDLGHEMVAMDVEATDAQYALITLFTPASRRLTLRSLLRQ